jgi:hypothetical protein
VTQEVANHFPDYVENYKLTYPLPDDLLTLLPSSNPPKPIPHRIMIPAANFENLLEIWDYFSSFGELIKLPKNFSIEDLEAALRYKGLDGETVGLIQSLMR